MSCIQASQENGLLGIFVKSSLTHSFSKTCIADIPISIADLEKRKNPVCHFVTPLDGSVEVDEHRRPEVC